MNAKERAAREGRVSAKKRADQHEVFSSTSVKLPDGVQLFAPKKEGTFRLEVIPFVVGKGNPFAEKGQLHFERTFWTHPRIGVNSDTYICPRKTFGKACPICEHRAKLVKDPDADEDTVKELSPKERQLFNVYNHAEPDKGVQLWDISFHLFGKHLDAKIRNADEDDGYEFFADPKDGMTLKVGCSEEKGGGYTYYTFADIEFKKRKEELDPDLLEKALPLDELLKEFDYDKLKKIFLEEDSEDEDEDDKPKKKKPAKDEDDEDDEDEKPKKKKPAADEDDEDDDKPAKKKPKPSDEDEDDDKPAKKKAPKDEDDEDEDDKPKKKKKEPVASDYDFIEVGAFVVHDDYGDCEIVKISGDGTSLTLEDDEGELKRAVSPADVKPKADKKKKSSAKPSDEDDEPDDDDKPAKKKPKPSDDEDDEDDKPKKKKKPADEDDD